MGHFFGGILQFLIIGLLIFLAIRLASGLFGQRRPAGAATGMGFGRPSAPEPMPRAAGAAAAPAPRLRGVDTTVTEGDLQAFQELHAAIQEAWSDGDLGRMRQLMTPEMVGYFSEE